MWLIDSPLFPSKVSSNYSAIMFAVRRTASVPGRIGLRDFVVKFFPCDLRYTLGALLKYLRHKSEGCFFLSYGGVLPPPKQDICSARCLQFICKVLPSSAVL